MTMLLKDQCPFCGRFQPRAEVALAIYSSFATSERRQDVQQASDEHAVRDLARRAFRWADLFIEVANEPRE